MDKRILFNGLASLLLVVSLAVHAEESASQPASEAVNQAQLLAEMGYFYGYSFGNMLKDGGSGDVNVDRLIQGLQDSLASSMPDLDQAQRERVIAEIQMRQEAVRNARLAEQQKAQEAEQGQATDNLTAASEFLIQNLRKEGIKSTPSGLQYEIITDKEGPSAKALSRVVVHYRGTLLDGTVFDESRQSPVEFGLQQVIPGWTEGLQLMSVGDEFRFFLHPDLAYGAGRVGQIPPNSLLIFEVELLDIK
ncbi:MAG: FKBP-type peptidyl-prolyl cis-trans isomerase [Pseudomonadales bacterium]|nr:FKBP-type peptidyl-prolyl cis-trans isomerase [Pseudomonadales bacterium]MBO6566537.1 FKBP-type peptidyl-prolyl cis-trans isomerase [Pseudomonadales bacterium]MBO6595544.1 FKBP-type peptidyl-prolyl cis-trans isomerase [Pseudomonadales bacterium]MBO6820898.1 FKBP-type peptidyl-prolyl cis-trans isomerase [Pseudomonadales bacterium]